MDGILEILLVLGILAVVAMVWRIASAPSGIAPSGRGGARETSPDDVVRRFEGWNV